MKVIVKGKVIETGFIVSIEKRWIMSSAPCNATFSYLLIIIKTVFGEEIILDQIGCTNDYYESPDQETIDTMVEVEAMADRIIKFLDDHSDKPNWPYPVFE